MPHSWRRRVKPVKWIIEHTTLCLYDRVRGKTRGYSYNTLQWAQLYQSLRAIPCPTTKRLTDYLDSAANEIY